MKAFAASRAEAVSVIRGIRGLAFHGNLPTSNVLTVEVLEARGLAARDRGKSSDPYCIVNFEGQERETSVIWKQLSPIWNETFFFEVKDPSSVLLFQVYDKDLFSPDDFLGQVEIPLSRLRDEDLHDDWLTLTPGSKKDTKISGDLHIRTRYTISEKNNRYSYLDSTCFEEYEELMDFLKKLPIEVFVHFFDHLRCMPTDDTLRALLIWFAKSSTGGPECLKHLIQQEVKHTNHAETLFRRNSLASKLIATYMNHLGSGYLEDVLGPICEDIVNNYPDVVELDPSRAAGPIDIDSNVLLITLLVEKCLTAIISTKDQVPQEIRLIFSFLKTAVEEKFINSTNSQVEDSSSSSSGNSNTNPGGAPTNKENIGTIAVGGLFFLRFICPAVLSPHLFGILDTNPPPHTARMFMLITKVLQNLANNITFENKEQFMQPMNTYLNGNFARVHQFLDELAQPIPQSILMERRQTRIRQAGGSRDIRETDVLFAMYDLHDHLSTHISTMIKFLEEEGSDKKKSMFSVPLENEEQVAQMKKACSDAKTIVGRLGTPQEFIKKRHQKSGRGSGQKKTFFGFKRSSKA